MMMSRIVAAVMICVGASAWLASGRVHARADGAGVSVTEVTRNVLVFGTGAGNVVASVGPDGALLVGTPAAADTAAIEKILEGRTKSAARYVLVGPEDPASSEGDAGWGKRGAFVAMQELAQQLIGGDVMGAPEPLPVRFVKLGVDRPRVAFSDVLAFDLNGEAIHIVHQPAGQVNANCLVHFHVANLIYFGDAFPGDEYPRIELDRGGRIDGLIQILGGWTDKSLKIVPARGKVATGTEMKEFVEMLTAVTGNVRGMVKAGMTTSEIVAAKPAAEFDAKWGHGRVTSDEFVKEVAESVVREGKEKKPEMKMEMK